jgi:hypothetical protein
MLMMICLTTSVGALRLCKGQHFTQKNPCHGHILNQSLVESHLKGIPGLRTLTTGGLAGGDLEGLGGQADGAFDAKFLALGALNELLADLLESSDLAAGQGDTDLVSFLREGRMLVQTCIGVKAWVQTYRAFAKLLLRLLVRHFVVWGPSRLERFCRGKVMKVIW